MIAPAYLWGYERCLAEIDGDPRFYTTSDAVLDREAVREAIGAQAINIVGISYGTRVAQEYLRRYPSRTRTVVLDGIVPPQLALGSEHARNLDAALKMQFARCTADAACAQRFVSPQATLNELLTRLRSKPEVVTYRDPLTHVAQRDAHCGHGRWCRAGLKDEREAAEHHGLLERRRGRRVVHEESSDPVTH